MIGIVELTAVALLVILVVYVNNLGARVRTLERSMSFVLHDRMPSERVRELAADATKRIEAMRLFRQETGADVKLAMAIVGSLVKSRDSRPAGLRLHAHAEPR